MKLKIFVILFLSFILLSSCSDKYDLDTTGIESVISEENQKSQM